MTLQQCFWGSMGCLIALCCACNPDSITRSSNRPAKAINIKSSVATMQENIAISYGVSFGECGGYCKTEFRFSKGFMECIKTGWDTTHNPPKCCIVSISDIEYSRLMEVINQNRGEFWSLPDRLGCPDCTDGGAEWISIGYKGKIKKVVYEHNSEVEPIRKVQIILREFAKKTDGRDFNLR